MSLNDTELNQLVALDERTFNDFLEEACSRHKKEELSHEAELKIDALTTQYVNMTKNSSIVIPFNFIVSFYIDDWDDGISFLISKIEAFSGSWQTIPHETCESIKDILPYTLTYKKALEFFKECLASLQKDIKKYSNESGISEATICKLIDKKAVVV